MKRRFATILILILTSSGLKAQTIDTFLLHYPISKYDKIFYQRIIEETEKNNLIHVQDYYSNGQIQMDAYSKTDSPRVPVFSFQAFLYVKDETIINATITG